MMTKLLRKLTHDVPVLNENTVVPLRVGSLSLSLFIVYAIREAIFLSLRSNLPCIQF